MRARAPPWARRTLLKNSQMSRSSALMLRLNANTVRVARSSSRSSFSFSRAARTSGGVISRRLGVGG
jgi:hypothetical protein